MRIDLIPKIPSPARILLRNAVWSYGRATSFARPLPDFLILGAQKAGTTALYTYLCWHPAILGPLWKEVSFFDRHYFRGESWYRGQFPNVLRLGMVKRRCGEVHVGEATPSYLFHPLAPERAAALLPEVRLIALLRNPVDRAYSHYQHEVALGREKLPFEEALENEEQRTRGEVDRMIASPEYFSQAWWSHTYRARGLYAEQIERWLTVFPQESLLVVSTEEYATAPERVYARVLSFLGAAPKRLRSYPRVFSRRYEEMKAETRISLSREYAEANARLYELLGRDLGWG